MRVGATLAGRAAAVAQQRVGARARHLLGRDREYAIAGHRVVLPPEHMLPLYARMHPTYDAYPADLVAALAPRSVAVVDVGANVGDTAVALLASGDHVRVRCVEGSTHFLPYLRRNVADFGDRVDIVDRFVGPVGEHTTLTTAGGTGTFGTAIAGGPESTEEHVDQWVTPGALIESLDAEVRVWKSDTDGFDLPVLARHWDTIADACDVIWFELDPALNLGDPGDPARVADLIGDRGLHVRVYDNLGRAMLNLPPAAAARGLRSVVDWLVHQRRGRVTTPYVDVWAVRPDLAWLLDIEH